MNVPKLIENSIYLIRGHKVMLDSDLAELYGVPIKRLNEQVHRNIQRFPEDFMFQLTETEKNSLRSQIAALKLGRGQHRKYRAYVFTEQGVAMLSSVLNSPKAIKVNIQIMRTFVRIRQLMASNADLARKIEELEKKYDGQFQIVFEAIRQLIQAPEPSRRKIGYTADHQEKLGGCYERN
ncbi:MAG TPA: ORF6N domain-containing protein [bacterium]|nr:ORF6N domain-containing protein [bacterium]